MSDSKDEPIHLEQEESTGDRFLVYGSDKGMRLDIQFEGETLWMTQAQIAQLFGRDVATISRHISSIFEEGELTDEGNLRKTQIARSTKPVALYSLDMVISVGYRVSSAQATAFRRWATGVLVQYARKGFVVDSVRLKQPDMADRFTELREIIRDIRSDEASVYREVKKICAMCQDYDGSTHAAQEFFQQTKAKLIYAVASQTPSEVIISRANANAPNMGLTNWTNDNIRKTDVTVSKNYLAEGEIKELNRLTTILLDIFEDQLDLGRLIVMGDARQLLDAQLANLGRSVLRHGGTVTAAAAHRKAEAEYETWKANEKAIRHRQSDEAITTLAAEVRRPSRK